MDDCDKTSDRMEKEEEVRKMQLQSARANKRVEEDCEECGVFIPLKRQEVTGGTSVCVDCLSAIERREQMISSW